MIASIIFCLMLTILYVVPLYLIPIKIRRLNRNDPIHIKYRLIVSSVSTLFMIILSYTLNITNTIPWNFDNEVSFLLLIGLQIDKILESVVITLLLFMLFYLGPIVVSTIHSITLCSYNTTISGTLLIKKDKISIGTVLSKHVDDFLHHYSKLVLFRNFVNATITEEIVFRALMIPLLYKSWVLESSSLSSSSSSPWTVILSCPIFFGIAHIHHCIEEIRNGSKVTIAIIKTVVQITYTSIFGFIAALLFMRTGNLISPLVAHIICNFFGLPDIGFMSKSSNELSFLYPYRYFLLFLHALGLILFSNTIMMLTENTSKTSFYWKY